MKAEKFVPLAKMSKKAQREYFKRKRKDWNGLNPVTRTAQAPKGYKRAAERSAVRKNVLSEIQYIP